jgi:hypothetical protein
MYGTMRGVATLIGAAIAGGLVWVATQVGQDSTGDYWGAVGILAGAGLVMALSQLVGGWTKWGSVRFSLGVFLIGFLPVLIAAGWVILASQPDDTWVQSHVDSWSGSIAIDSIVHDLRSWVTVLAFGVGLVFGFVFDTSGPRQPEEPERYWEAPAAEEPTTVTEPSEATAVDGGKAADTRRERVPTGRV